MTSSKTTPTAFSAQRVPAEATGSNTALIALRAPVADPNKPQIVGMDLLPERGLTIAQIYGYIPGPVSGMIPLLGPNHGHAGELLIPFANRIRGNAAGADSADIQIQFGDKNYTLPANHQGKAAGAEKVAIHGLLAHSNIEELELLSAPDSAVLKATFSAGDFEGHWPSETDLEFKFTLKSNELDIDIRATNVGKEILPMGIGWHPYFIFLGQNRKDIRLSLPIRSRLLVNNYDDVFPTGEIESVKGTPYDFSDSAGKPLADLYLDDCFVELNRDSRGHAEVTIVDEASHYGLKLKAISKEIQAIQAYSAVDQNFLALEPQYNWVDPLNTKLWGKTESHDARNSGMVFLEPSQSTRYQIQLQLFTPTRNH